MVESLSLVTSPEIFGLNLNDLWVGMIVMESTVVQSEELTVKRLFLVTTDIQGKIPSEYDTVVLKKTVCL